MSHGHGDDAEEEDAANVTKLLEEAFAVEAQRAKTSEEERLQKGVEQRVAEADLASNLEKAEFERVLGRKSGGRPDLDFPQNVKTPGLERNDEKQTKIEDGDREFKRKLRNLRIAEILQERHDRRRMLLARRNRDLRTLYRIEHEKTNRRGLRGRRVVVRRFARVGHTQTVICAALKPDDSSENSLRCARFVCWQCKVRPAQIWIRARNSEKRIGRCRECCRFF